MADKKDAEQWSPLVDVSLRQSWSIAQTYIDMTETRPRSLLGREDAPMAEFRDVERAAVRRSSHEDRSSCVTPISYEHCVAPLSYDDTFCDRIQISWEGDNDPENPMNWTWQKKWATTILVSCFTFISPFSSTMVTPALDDIGLELGIPAGFMRALVMSIFLLGYAQGPFVLAPLSEIFGRLPVLQYTNLIYLVFNTACGFAKTKNQILAFRFLSGIGGSAPQAVSQHQSFQLSLSLPRFKEK